jgi:hypothetical protein
VARDLVWSWVVARQALGFGFVVAAIAVLGSCRQIVGIEESPPVDISTSAGGLEFGTGACAACAEKSCIAESSACASSLPCKAYEECLGTCRGDAKCRSQCTTDHRVGLGSTSELSALGACLATHCEPDCTPSCGGVVAYVTPPASAAACETCLADDCDVENACARSTDCDAYVRCLLACSTPDCGQACASTYKDGSKLYGQFDATRYSKCAAACAYGNDWSCVGHFSAPAPTRNTMMKFAGIYDRSTINTTMTPIEGAQVTICGAVGNGTNLPCSPSLAPSLSTDASGDVTIPAVPIDLSLDHSGLIGYGRIQAAGCRDTWLFWGFPVSEPSVTWGPPFTPAAFLDPLPPSPQVGSGTVWVVPFDCLGHLAGGVHIKTPDGTEPDYYGSDGTFANVPRSPSPGIAEYENLPVGVYKFSAFPRGATRPSSVVIANVFEGAQSIVPLFPNQ